MKIYTGIVTNNDDPTHEGQVQVLIKDKDANTSKEDHTWCRVIGSSAFGLVGNTGVSSVLHNGTNVYCIYDNDDRSGQCYIIGTVVGQINSALFPDAKDNNGVHPIGNQGDSNIHPSCVNDYDSYSKTQVITTESGHMIRLTDMDGASEVDIMHKSGSFISFKDDGTIKIYAKKNLEIDVEGDMRTYVMKNNMSEIRGDSLERVLKGEVHNVGKDRSVIVKGEQSHTISKENITTVNGSNILNVTDMYTESVNGGKSFSTRGGYTENVIGNYGVDVKGGYQGSFMGGYNLNVSGQRSTQVMGTDFLMIGGTQETIAGTIKVQGGKETHNVGVHEVNGLTKGIIAMYDANVKAAGISLVTHTHMYTDTYAGMGTVPTQVPM